MNPKHRQRIDTALRVIREAGKDQPSERRNYCIGCRTEYARGMIDGLQAAGAITGDELLAELDAVQAAFNDAHAPKDAPPA